MEAATRVELDGQYRALREEAGAVDRSHRAKLLVRGADAADYLQGQLTNDVEGLAPGEGCYAALLDRKGHMQADMRVLRLDADRIWIDAEAAARGAVARHLEMYSIGRDVALDDLGAQRAIVSAIGPAAATRTDAGPLEPEHAHRDLDLDGIECRVVATDIGVDLICEAGEREALLAALEARGIVPVSEEAAEIVRVESGRPRFGLEMGTRTIPQEAGINERAVSFTKGCYIGQETVARLHYRGKPNRHLRGLRLNAPASAGDEVRLGDRELGAVGTAVISPALGSIALAILRREAEAGARVEVGDANEAEVVELPFEPGATAGPMP